jgi:broad-specificity NMP kinase
VGIQNYLIEGVSGTGKTTVAEELLRRGYHVVHGDRTLAYKGDPKTGEPLDMSALDPQGLDIEFGHRHHVWDVAKVRSVVADHSHPMTFFCGGSRNYHQFIELFDAVFVLDVDQETLKHRLSARPEDEFGGKPEEQAVVLRLHATQEDTPNGLRIDATAPLERVVDAILSHCKAVE